jgi:DNA-binding transcriptional LysR family regulator
MQRTPRPGPALHWDDVRLFLALCRSKTVGRAGKALGVDASTVSRRLVLLEESVKATLFDRGRDGITPTKAAEDLMPVAEEIEAVITRFTTAAEGLEREISGPVRITCPPDVAEVVVMPLLRTLRARHPALRFDLDPGESVLDLTRREADLALRTVRPTSGDLIVTRLLSMRWVVAAAPELARELGTLKRWTDAPWVACGGRLAQVGPARWQARYVTTEPAVRSESLSVLVAAVRTGIGVALLPEPSISFYGLVPVKLGAALRPDAAAWPGDDLFLVTHRALRHVPRVSTVWTALVQQFTRPTRAT